MSWAGPSGKGSVVLSNNTTDFVEGTGSMQLDYTVNVSQGWGGYINMTDTTWVFPDSFANRTALVLYVKNVNPLTGQLIQLHLLNSFNPQQIQPFFNHFSNRLI